MKLFYHHVGIDGADRDFPKTVFTDLPLSLVEESIGPDTDKKDEILAHLEILFPTKTFSCWGVPAGAEFVIKNLHPGDAVLLVRKASVDGDIPALTIVKAFWPIELPSLSMRLWGSYTYPYVFFFDTQKINLMWQTFLADVGYSPNWDPRGKFLSIADSRWLTTSFDSPEEYVQHILQKHASTGSLTVSTDEIEHLANELKAGSIDIEATKQEVKNLESRVMEPPTLTSDTEPINTQVRLIPRSAAFRIGVKKLYAAKCAICGLSLQSPNGDSEVQSAHIYPKQLAGSDDLRNGIALCRMHHWAFDVGWFTLSDDCTVIVREDLPSTNDYAFIHDHRGKKITLPIDRRFAPSRIFLEAHRKLHNFE